MRSAEERVTLLHGYVKRAMQKPRVKNLSMVQQIVRHYLAGVIRKFRMDLPYLIPEAIWTLIHLLTRQPAIDAVILDDQNRVLFMDRKDRWFKGYELVGGYGTPFLDTCAEWCNYLSRRDIGASVELLGFAGIHMWKLGEHAHGVPISMVAVCRLTSAPTKNLKSIMFSRMVPGKMVPNHGNFVAAALNAYHEGILMPEIL
jgi:hypothetical protein